MPNLKHRRSIELALWGSTWYNCSSSSNRLTISSSPCRNSRDNNLEENAIKIFNRDVTKKIKNKGKIENDQK